MHRKILAALIALLLVGIIAPVTIPRGHADDQSETLNVTGYTLRSTYDNYYGTDVNAITQGSTLTFTLYFVATTYGNFQRNVTMGVKFDWMNNYQNTTSSVPIAMGQSGYVTLAFNIPVLNSLELTTHSYTVEVWSLPIGGVWTNINCYTWYTYEIGNTSCRQFTSFTPIAVYSTTQANVQLTLQQAGAEISGLSTILSSTKQAPPGTSAAVANLAAAQVQLYLAENAYQTGNFNTAQSDAQNALNDANAAQSSLAVTGGGTDVAAMTSLWLTGAAVLMGGVGAVLLGLGGFKYMRGRTRALTGYAPTMSNPSTTTPTPPKP